LRNLLSKLIKQNDKKYIIKVVRSILPNCKIVVFGSRVDGTARKYSDLDISLDDGKRISGNHMDQIKENFNQSDIVYKIDISDWHLLESDFQEKIKLSSENW